MANQEKNGSSVFPARQAQISGAWVDLYPVGEGFAVDKNDAQRLMQRKLGIKARQARAAVSSYRVEGWAANSGTLFGVSSLEYRMLDHVDRRVDSRRENGSKSKGRPPKPAWDVTPSSGIKQRQVIETQVAAEHLRTDCSSGFNHRRK
jgi:hypothetical protein